MLYNSLDKVLYLVKKKHNCSLKKKQTTKYFKMRKKILSDVYLFNNFWEETPKVVFHHMKVFRREEFPVLQAHDKLESFVDGWLARQRLLNYNTFNKSFIEIIAKGKQYLMRLGASQQHDTTWSWIVYRKTAQPIVQMTQFNRNKQQTGTLHLCLVSCNVKLTLNAIQTNPVPLVFLRVLLC